MDQKYKAINIFYLIPGQTLEFDVYIYLPVNNKYIKYVSEHEPIDEVQILKLKLKNVNDLFIREEDLDKYNNFLAKSITLQLNDQTLNEKEKIQIIKKAAVNVIESISSITGDEDAISWTNHCIDITKTLVGHITGETNSSVYDKLRELISDSPNLINHSLLVSSLSSIFGMALGIYDSKSISELSVGGLLHDIGLSKTTPSVVEKYFVMKEFYPSELEELKLHPQRGFDLIKKALRSPKISDNVIKIIADHHENASGTGYPSGKGIPAISYLCRIAAIADRISLHLSNSKDQGVDLKYLVSKLFKAQGEVREFDKNILGQLLETIK